MSDDARCGFDWETFPFDEEIILEAIPDGSKTSAIYVSIVPKPSDGGVRILGKMPNGGTGSVTLLGRIYAAKLPFADRVIRLQYLGYTRSVDLKLSSYVPATVHHAVEGCTPQHMSL